MTKLIMRAVVGAALFAASAAHAALVEWTLENVTFNDSGTATGFFVVDTSNTNPDPITVTDFHVVTTPGLLLNGFDFNPTSAANGGLQITDHSIRVEDVANASHVFYLNFDGDPRHATSGTLNVVLIINNQLSSESLSGGLRQVEGGFISAAVVPEPSALAMAVVGALILVGSLPRGLLNDRFRRAG